METEDRLTRALEPGERIVWSDGPHGLRAWARVAGATRATLPLIGLVLFLDLVVIVLAARLAPLGGGGPLVGRGEKLVPVLLVFGTLGATGTLFLIGELLAATGARYAATDRGRLLVARRGKLTSVVLPPRTRVTTLARGAAEQGDVVLALDPEPPRGARVLVLVGVSYPLAAVESLRSVAPAGEDPARARPPVVGPGEAPVLP